MLDSLSRDNRTVLNIIVIIAGLGLALSPWYLGYTAESHAAWNAWIVGAGVAVVGALAIFAFHEAEEWVNLALGVWAVIAPWLLGFAALAAATTAHMIAGLIVAIMAACSLWFTPTRPYSAA
jgi:SPW repeat